MPDTRGFFGKAFDKITGRKKSGIDWLDICKDLNKENRIDDLRSYLFTNVNSSNLPNFAKYFPSYTGSTSDITAFHIYLLSLKKRDLCISLGKYFESQTWK